MASWWQRLAPYLRPPRTLKTTRVGRTYLVLTLGIGLGALNTGNNLLYLVLGFLLGIIVMSGVLSERVISGLRIRRLVPDGAFAGEPFALRYEVTRAQGRSFALKLSEAGAALEGWAWVPVVTAGHPAVVRADMVAARRGPLRLGQLRVTTSFPLGLFEKSRLLAVEDLLVVYPRRGFACVPPASAEGRQSSEAGSPRRRDGTGDLLGLRELAPGEDARRVHWKKSAAVGKLLKVEREREDKRQYTLRVDPLAPQAELDRACEETAAVTQLLLSDGHEVGLVSGKRRLRPGAGPGQEKRVLSALAWAGFEEEPR